MMVASKPPSLKLVDLSKSHFVMEVPLSTRAKLDENEEPDRVNTSQWLQQNAVLGIELSSCAIIEI
jgi:hypothetical protein